MKRGTTTIILAACLALAPGAASANVDQGTIVGVYMLGANACAIEVRIDDAVGDVFNGQETISIAGTAATTFDQLPTSVQSLTAGDIVLAASPAFESEAGFAADIGLTNADCADLRGGDAIEFTGSMGQSLDLLTLPASFGLDTAFTGGALVDLTVDVVTVRALLGAGGSIGAAGGPGPGPGPGVDVETTGCSVAPTTRGAGSAALLSLGLLGLLVLSRRRRRHGQR
ncbi:MAG: hypothetical protein KC503_03745 [Myxococcales bacterium]|nr:hypothetical protein [Myxococcales bacterium]